MTTYDDRSPYDDDAADRAWEQYKHSDDYEPPGKNPPCPRCAGYTIGGYCQAIDCLVAELQLHRLDPPPSVPMTRGDAVMLFLEAQGVSHVERWPETTIIAGHDTETGSCFCVDEGDDFSLISHKLADSRKAFARYRELRHKGEAG